jgi:hypothetical protein
MVWSWTWILGINCQCSKKNKQTRKEKNETATWVLGRFDKIDYRAGFRLINGLVGH